jgi:hypothetical protein
MQCEEAKVKGAALNLPTLHTMTRRIDVCRDLPSSARDAYSASMAIP